MGKQNRNRRHQKRQAPKGGSRSSGGSRFTAPSRAARAGSDSGQGSHSASDPAIDPTEVVHLAVELLHQGDTGAFEQMVWVLSEAAGVAGGRRAVDRALAGEVTAALKGAWSRGWQPAEVVRCLGRLSTPDHRRHVAMAVVLESDDYPQLLVDPRWSDQVRALASEVGAAVPPANADGAWAVGGAPDRSNAVRLALQCLEITLSLPPIAVLLPLPGQGSSRGPANHHVDEALLRRVRALLAKAESTTFEDEALALTAKAQDLMTRHSIDQIALGEPGEESDRPIGVRIPIDDPYAGVKSVLLSGVAYTNRCRSVFLKDMGYTAVYGHADDLETVEILYTSLLVQATTVMTAMGRQTSASGRSRTRSFRQSFLMGFATRIAERLDAATSLAEADGVATHGAALVPVLADRTRAVEDALAEAHPHTARSRPSVGNAEGWRAGRATADTAALWGSPQVECEAAG